MLFICIILFILAKASKAEKKLCGFAFMRLTDDEDIVIKDAFHNLCIYKVSILHWEAVGITPHNFSCRKYLTSNLCCSVRTQVKSSMRSTKPCHFWWMTGGCLANQCSYQNLCRTSAVRRKPCKSPPNWHQPSSHRHVSQGNEKSLNSLTLVLPVHLGVSIYHMITVNVAYVRHCLNCTMSVM